MIKNMIPKFNTDGLLPSGLHLASIDEVEKRFTHNDHRGKIFDGFKKAISSLKQCGCKYVYLDGSFVTTKQLPSDFDACWEEEGVDIFALRVIEPVLLEFSNNRAAQKAKFMGEFFPAKLAAENKHPHRVFLDFFQTDKNTGHTKGIIKIKL